MRKATYRRYERVLQADEPRKRNRQKRRQHRHPIEDEQHGGSPDNHRRKRDGGVISKQEIDTELVEIIQRQRQRADLRCYGHRSQVPCPQDQHFMRSALPGDSVPALAVAQHIGDGLEKHENAQHCRIT